MARIKKAQTGTKKAYISVGDYNKADSLGRKGMADFKSKSDSIMNKFNSKIDSSLSKRTSSLSDELDKMAAEKMKNRTKQRSGGKTPMTSKQKKFASLAPPKNKITFADRIVGAKGKKASVAKKGVKIGGSGMKKCKYGCK